VIFCNITVVINYIKNNNSDILQYYNSIVPGAYKADLFRALYIYNEGGIYFDCKMILFRRIDYAYKYEEFFCEDKPYKYIYNAFFCVKNKNNKNINLYIKKMIENISSKKYGKDPFSITGPGCMGEYIHNNIYMKLIFVDTENKNPVIINENKKILIKNTYYGYYDENNYIKTGHYVVLWENKQIYI
jgi:hypothetical protein